MQFNAKVFHKYIVTEDICLSSSSSSRSCYVCTP